jgi:hypothetical protein
VALAVVVDTADLQQVAAEAVLAAEAADLHL